MSIGNFPSFTAPKIEKLVKNEFLNKDFIDQLNNEYDNSVYSAYLQKYQKEIIKSLNIPKDLLVTNDYSYNTKYPAYQTPKKRTELFVDNNVTNLRDYIYSQFGEVDYVVDQVQENPYYKKVTIIHKDKIEKLRGLCADSMIIDDYQKKDDTWRSFEEYYKQISQKAEVEAKFIIINKIEILIPFKESRDLILSLSTDQKVKGWFNYNNKKFYAFPVSEEQTSFSLNKLNIHNFVIGWKVDPTPDEKYNFENYINKASSPYDQADQYMEYIKKLKIDGIFDTKFVSSPVISYNDKMIPLDYYYNDKETCAYMDKVMIDSVLKT